MGNVVGDLMDIFGHGPASKQAASANAAARLADASANRSMDLQKEMFDKQIELQEPWRKAGVEGLNRLSAGLAQGGEFDTPFSKANWQQDPGYGFRVAEGMKALERSAAARGGLMGGAQMKAIQRYGQDMGSQEYQNAFNRYYAERENALRPLQSLAGIGQSSAHTMGDDAGRYGSNVGNIMSMNAANQGNALMAQGNIRASQYRAVGRGLESIANSKWGQARMNDFKNWWDNANDDGEDPYDNGTEEA